MGFTTIGELLGSIGDKGWNPGKESGGGSEQKQSSAPRQQGDVGSETQRLYQGTTPKSDKGQGDITDYSDVIKAAEETDDPDAYKYATAVRIVDNQIGNEQTLGDDEYRAAIDATFDQMNPTVTGSTMRGEDDILSGAVRTARNAIDDVNETAGQGIDWLWDNTVGNLAGAAGVAGNVGGSIIDLVFNGGKGDEWDPESAFDNAKKMASDLVTPETGAIASDILIDLGLSAIPGVGIGLAAGKNAIQQSENIYEAISGRDDITGEEIDFPQRAAKGLLGVGSVALSAVPGIGKAKNADDIAKSGKEMIDEYTGMIDDADNVLGFLDDVSAATSAGNVDDVIKMATGRTDDVGKELTPLLQEIEGLPAQAGRNAERVTSASLDDAIAAYADPSTMKTGLDVADEGSRLSKVIDDVASSYREPMQFQKEIAQSGLENAQSASRINTPMAVVDSARQRISDYPENFKGFMKQAGGNIKGGHPIQAIRDVRNAFAGPVDINDSMMRYAAMNPEAGFWKKRGYDVIENLSPMVGNAMVDAAVIPTAMYAELGDDWVEGVDNMIDDMDPRVFAPYAMSLMLAGTAGGNRMSRNLPNVGGSFLNPKGTAGRFVNQPLAAAQGAALSNYMTENPYGVYDDEIDPGTLEELMREAGDR